MYGDPQRLYAMAAMVEQRERDLRTRVSALRDAGRATRWSSAAGATHRARLEDDLSDLLRCADGLAEAAAALRAHAADVSRLLQRIADAEREVRAWFRNVQHSVASRVDAAVDAFQDIVTDALPWSGWRWTPESLPRPGSVDWLDAADLVRRTPWRS